MKKTYELEILPEMCDTVFLLTTPTTSAHEILYCQEMLLKKDTLRLTGVVY